MVQSQFKIGTPPTRATQVCVHRAESNQLPLNTPSICELLLLSLMGMKIQPVLTPVGQTSVDALLTQGNKLQVQRLIQSGCFNDLSKNHSTKYYF